MKAHHILFILFISAVGTVRADSIMPPRPLVFTNDYGSDVFFTMTPALRDDDYNLIRKPYGVAYKVDSSGKLNELYKTEGWYSFKIFISYDGQYLVRMGPWNTGSQPEDDHLAVAFYQNGKLLKEYSTLDLVKDTSKVIPTVSHYFWMAPDPTDRGISEAERHKFRLSLGLRNRFVIYTIDGWRYLFDITTGDIISESKTKG